MKEIPAIIAVISLIILASFLSSLDFSRTGFPGLIGVSVFEKDASETLGDVTQSTSEISLSENFNPACFPLFIVSGIDENHVHLRTHVSSKYQNGKWVTDDLMLNVSMSFTMGKIYAVKPLVELSGFLPVAKDTVSISIPAGYNSSAGVFYGENVSNPYYGVISPPESFPYEKGDYESIRLDIPYHEFLKIRELALRITENASSDYERARMIENYLKTHYEYSPRFNNTEISPYMFLFQEKKGMCMHFATAFIALATSIDLPARAVFGYLAKPTSSSQVVYSCQAHMWAEVKFGDYWVEFDPTPQVKKRIPTVTEITEWSEEIVEGEKVSVRGTVRLEGGEAVQDGYVEIYLKKNKTDPDGILLGVASIENGEFHLTEEVNESGKYSIVAHYTGSLLYVDSWSDPEVKVLALPEIETNLRDYIPLNFVLKGRIVHGNQTVPNKTVAVYIDGTRHLLKTDENGEFELALRLSKGVHKIEVVSPKEGLFGEVRTSKSVNAGEFDVHVSNTTLVVGEENRVVLRVLFNSRPYSGMAEINGVGYGVRNGSISLIVTPENTGDFPLRIVVGGYEENLVLESKARTNIVVKEEGERIIFRVVSGSDTVPEGVVEVNGRKYELKDGMVAVEKGEGEYRVRYYGDRDHLPTSLIYRPSNPLIYFLPLPVLAGIAGYCYLKHPRIRFEFEKEHPELPALWKVDETIRYRLESNYPCTVEVDGRIVDGAFSLSSPGIYRVVVRALRNGKVKKKVERDVEIVDDYGKGVERVFKMFEGELEKRGIRTSNLTAREILDRWGDNLEEKKKLLRLFELYEYASRGGYSRKEFVEAFEIYLHLRRGLR